MRKEEVSCGLVLGLLMLAAGSPIARADVLVYQDRAAWEAAASAAGLDTALETFDGFADTFPDGNLPDFSVGPIDFADNDVSLTGDNGISEGMLFAHTDGVFFRSENVSVAPGAELRGMAFDHALNAEPDDFIDMSISVPFSFDDFIPENSGSTFIGFIAGPGDLGTSFFFEAFLNFGGWDSFDNMRVAFFQKRSAQVSLFRDISATATLVETSQPQNLSDDESQTGPSEGFWSDIVDAEVVDPEPSPTGDAFGFAGQMSDAVFSEGEWIVTGSGTSGAESSMSIDVGQASAATSSGISFFSVTIAVEEPSTARIEAVLTSNLLAATGDSSAIYNTSLTVCESGGGCLVSLAAQDTVVGPNTSDQVTFNDTLALSSPGTYQLRIRSDSFGSGFPGHASDGTATWNLTLTVPEPGSGLLGLAALVTLVALYRTRRHHDVTPVAHGSK
jgi:hypothetical protein